MNVSHAGKIWKTCGNIACGILPKSKILYPQQCLPSGQTGNIDRKNVS